METTPTPAENSSALLGELNDFISALPFFVKALFLLLLGCAIVGIAASHILAVQKHRREWKPKPGSHLMFSYFCDTGPFQREKIYPTAHQLLRDRTWLMSPAGLSYRFENYTHPSKMLMFACSLLCLPLMALGYIEMGLRIGIGTVWLLGASLIHRLLLFALHLLSYALIPLWQLADKTARVEQHCPHCYNTFDLPEFKCPHCGALHKQLIPSRCGILVARCSCGRFLSSSAFTGRSRLDALCPKCSGDLVAANAKQFSLQLIGGSGAGKTSFLAAFQHQYMETAIQPKLTLRGDPSDYFAELEKLFKGQTTDAATSGALTCSLVHTYGRTAKNNLVIYDIPGEFIIDGTYERNPQNFGFCDGLIFVIDPLSIASVREECQESGNSEAVENYSRDDMETVIVRFIHQFSEIVGRSSRKMHKLPVAVLISKTDIKAVNHKVGPAKIKALYTANPSLYQNQPALASHEICRDYLSDLGLANALNNLESVFSNVRYFPVSAIGHISETGQPFHPAGVMEPIAWIAREAGTGIDTLRKTQGRDTQ